MLFTLSGQYAVRIEMDERPGSLRVAGFSRWVEFFGLGRVIVSTGLCHASIYHFTRSPERCPPYHTQSAFYPVIEHLERAARFEGGDNVVARLDKVEALLEPWRGDVAAMTPLIAALLSIPTESRYGLPRGTSQERKNLTLAALMVIIHRPAFVASGIERFKSSGRKTWLAWWLLVRADAELHEDRAEKAGATVEEALAAIGEIGENQFLALAISLQGDVRFAFGPRRCMVVLIRIYVDVDF